MPIVLPIGFSIKRLVRTGSPHTSLEAAQQAHKSSAKAIYQVAKLMMDGLARIDEEIWIDCRTMNFRRHATTVRMARLALSESGYLVSTGIDRPTFAGCKSQEWIWYGTSISGVRQSSYIVDSRPTLHQLIAENDNLRSLVSESIKRIKEREQQIKELEQRRNELRVSIESSLKDKK